MSQEKLIFSDKEKALIENLLEKKFDEQKPAPSFKLTLLQRLLDKFFLEESYYLSLKKYFINFYKNIFSWIWKEIYILFNNLIRISLAFILIVVTTSTYAYKSPSVTHESNLFFIKKVIESIELASAYSDTEKAEKYLKFAERRREELEVLLEKDIVNSKTLEEIAQNTNKALVLAQNIQDEEKREEIQNKFHESSEKQKESLNKVIVKLEEEKDSTLNNDSDLNNKDSIVIVKNQINDFEDLGKVVLKNENDFKDIKVTSIKKFPDLLVEKIQQENESSMFFVYIKNIGEEDAGNFSIDVNWGDMKSDSKEIYGMFIGDTKKIAFSHEYENNEIFDVVASIDYLNQVVEKNENNNSLKIQLQLLCINTTCNKGEKKCNGNSVDVCEYDENNCLIWKKITTCMSGNSCENGECKTNPIINNLLICKIGEKRCNAQFVEKCEQFNWDETANWFKFETCKDGCSNGECLESNPIDDYKSCKIGEMRCNGLKLEKCTQFNWDEPQDWLEIETCTNDCINGRCD